jgi:hypothetical protein
MTIPAPRRHPSRRSVRLLEKKNPSSNSQTATQERSVPLRKAASSAREHTLPISLSRSDLIAQSNSPVKPIHPSEPSHLQIPNLQPQQLNQISTTATYAVPCPESIEPPPQLRQPSLGQRNQDPSAVDHPTPYRLHSQSRLQTYTAAEQSYQSDQYTHVNPPIPLMSTSHGMRQNSPSNWSEQPMQQDQAGPSHLLNPSTLDAFPRFDPTSSANHRGSSQLLAQDLQLLPRNHHRQATPGPSSQCTLPYEPRREFSHVVPPSQPVDLSHSSSPPAANYPQQISRASLKQPIPSHKPFHTMSPHEQREALQRRSPSQSSVSTAGQRSMNASPIPPASTPPNVR